MAKKKIIEKDFTAEEKIKTAAAKVFQQKGFAGTRTRDIAEEAGINLALLNYYYRSKQNLFEIVMQEKMGSFFGHMLPVLLNPQTSLDVKVTAIANNYIDLLLENPDLPLFILNVMRANPEGFKNIVKGAEMLHQSAFVIQLQEKNSTIKPEQFFINIMSLCIFPFAMKPGLQAISATIAKDFTALMEERKRLIPIWTKAMLKAK